MTEGEIGVPLVSVLVTVFNREPYLAECLTSILASTFTDFEVIVVDDASTDKSPSIARDFAARDSRIRLFENPSNLGDYGNRTRAAQLARGRYLKYLDSDDLIYPHSLRLMVDAMEANEDAALGLSHSMAEDEQPYPWCLTPREAWRKEFLGNGCLGCGPSGTIIRRDAFFEIGGFRDFGVVNDTDLWYRLSSRWPVVLLPPGLVWWRRHENQEYTANNARLSYLDKGFAVCIDALTQRESPLASAERAAALSRARHRQARRLLSLALKDRRPRAAWRLMRKAELSAGDIVSGFGRYR